MDNNDFILKIVAELEQKGIKTGYDKLKKELEKDPAKIDVILNTSGTVGKTKGSIKKLAAELHNELSVEIKKLQKKGQDINFDLSVGDVEEVIQNIINHTKKLEQNFDAASAKAQKFLAQFNNKSGGTLVNSAEFKAVQEAINGLGNTHSIDDLNRAMNTLETTYNNMVSSLRNSGKSLNPFINAKNEMAVMSETIKGIGLEFEQLSSKPKSVADAISELSTQQGKVDSYTIGTQEWADAYGLLQQKIQKVTAEISNLQRAQSSKSLQPQIDKIQLSMSGQGKVDYNWQVDEEIKKLRNLGFTEEEVAQKVKVLADAHTKLKQAINSNEFDSIESKNRAIIESDKERTLALNQVKNAYKDLKTDASQYYNLNKQTRLSTDIQNWLSKNTRASQEAKDSLNAYYRELSDGRVPVDRLDYIRKELDTIDAAQRKIGKLGKTFIDQFKQGIDSFKAWLSVTTVVMTVIEKTKSALSELKEVNTILTEISKANDKLTKSQLAEIGNSAFDVASKYGKNATDYLTGVQEMSRAGYENAESMAELSVAAQGAGDMTAELANQYIIATDVAFKMNGSIEALTATLDGANSITNHNAVNMTELAEGMSVVGTQAASSQMEVNEITAAIGTMVATTQKSGREMGNAFKGILMNLQQVSGDVGDGEDIIDAESLTKYEKACAELGVSLKEVRNGVVSLKEPMQILKELAEEYTKLDEADAKRANLLSAVGGKYRANALNAILENYDLYEKMLQDYADGMGSMAIEAEKTANSWEGSLNRLSNTWTDTVENIADSDAIITIINGLNNLLSVVNNVTDKLGSLGTIGLGATLFAGFKNVGSPKMFGLKIVLNIPTVC